ncbi:MAG: 3,4-dihydroxy-2-butanone-4-phosphate synthase [Candidatus Altiarchaeota archaeon]
MDSIEDAIKTLRDGSFVLVHDADGRENETDLVVAAEKITPEHITRMRCDGGGLVCVSVGGEIAGKLGLPFLHDVYAKSKKDFPLLAELEADDIPYDEKSSFSITVNHRKTFTGITDEDRALTIRELAYIAKAEADVQTFGLNFRSPGHVHILVSSGLSNREGHTELSEALLSMANLAPLAVICEMMDSKTHKSLPPDEAHSYAKENGFVFLESSQVKKAWKEKNG